MEAGDVAATPSVDSALDSAASKGIIHPNKAARKKSRLAKAVAAHDHGAREGHQVALDPKEIALRIDVDREAASPDRRARA